MGDIVFAKKIRVVSRGRFTHKKGIILGPERFFHKEEVSVIRDLLTSYPSIDIEEKTERDNNLVKLNLENYDKKNERRPIGMEEDVDPVPDTAEDVTEERQEEVQIPEGTPVAEEDTVTVDGVPVGNAEDTADDTEGVAKDIVADDAELIGADDAMIDDTEDQAPVVEEKQQEQTNQAQQQKQGGKKKNRNKSNANKESIEVTPKEA